ncbi:MAG: hypothetical protein K0R60_2 [Microbacterium sp.]|nr:hypothetical protein [Microbacterium sp.]
MQQDDIWRRNSDGVEVYVEMVADSWDPSRGRDVSWGQLDSDRENICTERWFVNHYTLVERQS